METKQVSETFEDGSVRLCVTLEYFQHNDKKYATLYSGRGSCSGCGTAVERGGLLDLESISSRFKGKAVVRKVILEHPYPFEFETTGECVVDGMTPEQLRLRLLHKAV